MSRRVRERVEIMRCFRCLGFGHRAGDCKGTDRAKLCKVYGKSRHKRKDYTGVPQCLICQEAKIEDTEHLTGSGKC